jgi:hypothetical protein
MSYTKRWKHTKYPNTPTDKLHATRITSTCQQKPVVIYPYRPIPTQVWTEAYGSRSLRRPEYIANRPCAPAAFTPQDIFLVLSSVRVWVEPTAVVRPGRIKSMQNPNNLIRNRNLDLSACGAELQPTAPPACLVLRNRWYIVHINHSAPELNPSAQRCLPRYF